MEARRTRRQLQFQPVSLTTDQVYDLVYAETGNEDVAEQAARRHMAAQLRSGATPT